MCDVTRDTPVRKLRFSTLRALSDLLDPQHTWRSVATDISGASGEARYSQQHIRRFEAVVLQGKSPTMEMLFDWGTTDCTVGDLVEILLRHQLLAAVSVLLPDHSSCHASAGAPAHQRFIFIFSIANSLPLSFPQSLKTTLMTVFIVQGHVYSFCTLTVMTGGWDDRPVKDGGCLLGTGGFGVVFRGSMGGTDVACLSAHKSHLISDML
uniref:Interleukin-1 receptor-associated kinase 4 n=1 Tax=Cyprinus carpio TaxID=7962 RepID=A0A8C1V7L7_CYPCA